jgi:hypothetical protein
VRVSENVFQKLIITKNSERILRQTLYLNSKEVGQKKEEYKHKEQNMQDVIILTMWPGQLVYPFCGQCLRT